MKPKRLFVEKKNTFQTEVERLRIAVHNDLNIDLVNLRKWTVYEIFHADEKIIDMLKWQVFGEIAQDIIYEEIEFKDYAHLAYAYLPGQYDQRADSAMQCIQLVTGRSDIIVQCATLISFEQINSNAYTSLAEYLINPVEMGVKDISKEPELPIYKTENKVTRVSGFIQFDEHELNKYYNEKSFAMKIEDLRFIQTYFKKLNRNPSETEIYVLDTYWSDHCRHTTFETILDEIKIEDDSKTQIIQESLNKYYELRKKVHKNNKPMTLMDMATLYGKYMIQQGLADDVEISKEVNACSIKTNAEGETYLLMFKNETHNHPTEIEPFGGASTCIGGAIRDPLSGRAYVYQAARVTGAANVLAPISQTRKGKLPQAIITKKATEGFSSYGNQIGLATTLVREIYHPGYEAKRLELGAVVGMVKYENIKRETPEPGDLIILIGGATGRDGIGGATGSSKSHDQSSVIDASSEVQKGNALIERKLQRLFLHPEVTKIIKKANDFGAGGVSVAIGELAAGIKINLDLVPTKYIGLNATELAISESQERMAVVIDPKDFQLLNQYVEKENLTAHHVATVTQEEKLVMTKNNQTVVEIDREFLDKHGVRQHANVVIQQPISKTPFDLKHSKLEDIVNESIQSLNTASQQGMIEYFDSTIGQTTVLMPFGGKHKLTESDASVHKLPLKDRQTDVTSILTFGFDPNVSSWSPYHGAYLAIVEAISKVVAVNGNYRDIRFSFQEYFQKLEKDPIKWGSAVSTMLGAIAAQDDFQMPSIGGKDSMSGTFEDLHVPPTFVAFAVTTGKASKIISSEFKSIGNYVYLVKVNYNQNHLPDAKQLLKTYDVLKELMDKNQVISAKALLKGGWLEAIIKMSFGNHIGFELCTNQSLEDASSLHYGGIVIETTQKIEHSRFIQLGQLIEEPIIKLNESTFNLDELLEKHKQLFARLYPISSSYQEIPQIIAYKEELPKIDVIRNEHPVVTIISLPGTNCELDSKFAFEDAGAKVIINVFRNQNEVQIQKSIIDLKASIDQSDIFMIPGGFSAGDEPDGSGKFITAILLNPMIKAAIERLQQRKGLIIGICNGFQALIKSGLLPFGKLGDVHKNSPTLTINHINRHVSKMVYTKVINNHSPWYKEIKRNTIHHIPISHGEGRFYANQEMIELLINNHQITTIYVDDKGHPAIDGLYNPNGSVLSIEGITSPDGRILGKMGHSERYGNQLYKNIPGNKLENIFKSAVETIRRGN